MDSRFERNYRRLKQRRILAISAGGETGGIQCLYIINEDADWEVAAKTIVPYPSGVDAVIESSRRQAVTLADLAWLDRKLTFLMVEAAKSTLAPVPRSLRTPHVAAFNQLTLYKGVAGKNKQPFLWNVSIGEPQFVADVLALPVLSDFTRYNLLSGGNGSTSFLPGNLRIVQRFSGIVVLLNLGLIARMTIIDRSLGRCLVDSDAGPGTILINRCARESNPSEGIDRDGSGAAAGTADVTALDALATSPWFLTAAPREAPADLFDPLLHKPGIMRLAPNDKLATITALTARAAYDFFRAEYKDIAPPEAIILSGGGANNAAIIKCLAAYFVHTPMINIEELGIPLEMRVPFAMGLTVDAYLREKLPEVSRICRVSLP